MNPITFPTPDQLEPIMRKLEANPGSIALIAIEVHETRNYPSVQWGWFNTDERAALKRALTTAKRKREAAKEANS